MNRPFYVNIPRNIYGEHLTYCPFTIKSMLDTPTKELITLLPPLELSEAEVICEKMNDTHEAELAAIYI